MRIIHFVPYFPPERIGGVGEVVAGIHQALRARGHTSTVVTAGIRSEPDVRRISRRPLGWFLKTALWAGKASRYDVVHCQNGEALPLLVMLALRRQRPKVLTTFHCSYRGIGTSFRPYTIAGRTFARGLRPFVYRTAASWLHRLLDQATRRLSDAVNAISVQSARDVFGNDDGAHVIYNGVTELGDEAETGAPELERTEILYVGAGGHRKRVTALPFVLRHVREKLPEARLRIVGFPPASEPEMVALFAEHGLLPAVDFAGVKSSAELAPDYASAGVLVVPSAYEGLPMVILEAMRSGLPVVATRVGAHAEAVEDGVNGFLVDPDEPRQMAERCALILRDRALRQRMGEAAQRTIRQRFLIDRQVEEYLAIYRKLLRQAPTANRDSA